MGRTANGEGSIRQLFDGSYECVIQSKWINPKTGNPKRIKRKGYTANDAQIKAKQALSEWENAMEQWRDVKVGERIYDVPNCLTCIYKGNRCCKPEGFECTRYKRKEGRIEHTFKFETDSEWIPKSAGCWIDCPFSFMLKWGSECPAYKNTDCPFEKYETMNYDRRE